MDRSVKKPDQHDESDDKDDDCYIVSADINIGDKNDVVIIRAERLKRNHTCVVKNSNSGFNHEYLSAAKKPKIHEINSDGGTLQEIIVTEKKKRRFILEPPIVITDDEEEGEDAVRTEEQEDEKIQNKECREEEMEVKEERKNGDDRGSPVLMEENSYKIFSSDKYMHKSAGPQRNSFEINDEETSNESIFVLSSDSESSLEAINMRMPGDEPIMTVEKPREKTTKRVFMKSDVSGRKKCRRLKRKLSDQKAGTGDTGKSKCNIPGCFLLELETSKRYTGKNFKHNRDELAQKIYNLINLTVFDQKMPEKIEIGWNKKMLKTAGLCSSGELQSPEKQRFAKIEISLKVCDSADRLRDTLIHELCHAASWLLDGVRDSHGDMWQNYARKCNMIHPELPKVTRCHNYQINYKILYECTKCKNRVGRYTRSLNTNLFTCAKCRGKLVLLPLTQKDGTPIRPHVRPFAKYVKENYGIISKSKEGITHGEIMKRLSKDYVAKKQKGNI